MKMDRLIGILSILLQREQVTAPELVEQFEVSRRTIQRDIEALCRAGIPITTARGAGGGISIMEGYRVDRTVLTAPEMQAILAGLRSLDSVSGTRRYAQLMEKLSAGNRGHTECHGAAPPCTFHLRRAQGHIGAQRRALLSGLSLVHMVSVGLVSNPAGLPLVQAQPHDKPFYRRSLYTTPSPFAGFGPGADLSHTISGVRSLCPGLPLAAGGRIRCRQLYRTTGWHLTFPPRVPRCGQCNQLDSHFWGRC